MANLSPKELLYLEDALSHEQLMQKKCCDLSSKLTDAELKTFIQGQERAHKDRFNMLYNLLVG